MTWESVLRRTIIVMLLALVTTADAAEILWYQGTAPAPLMENFEGDYLHPVGNGGAPTGSYTAGDRPGVSTEPNGFAVSALFEGQTATTDASGFESVTGSPTGPLTLAAQGAHENVGFVDWATFGIPTMPPYTTELYGLVDGSPGTFDGFGYGAVSILFDEDVKIFGMLISSVDVGFGDISLQFFERDGTLIETIEIAPDDLMRTDHTFVDKTTRIAGITITNTDLRGLTFDNFRFIPIPGTLALTTLGLLGFLGCTRAIPQIPV